MRWTKFIEFVIAISINDNLVLRKLKHDLISPIQSRLPLILPGIFSAGLQTLHHPNQLYTLKIKLCTTNSLCCFPPDFLNRLLTIRFILSHTGLSLKVWWQTPRQQRLRWRWQVRRQLLWRLLRLTHQSQAREEQVSILECNAELKKVFLCEVAQVVNVVVT